MSNIPDPGVGYRILRPEEILEKDDECWYPSTRDWILTSRAGNPAGGKYSSNTNIYRRKVHCKVFTGQYGTKDPGIPVHVTWQEAIPEIRVIESDAHRTLVERLEALEREVKELRKLTAQNITYR